MKKIGIIILGIVILALILILTLILEVIEFIAGTILFFVAAIVMIYLYRKVKDKFE